MEYPTAIWAVVIDPNVQGLIVSEDPILCKLVDHRDADPEEGVYWEALVGEEQQYHVVVSDSITWNQLSRMYEEIVTIEDGSMGDGVVVMAALDHNLLRQALKGARGMLTAVKARLSVLT